MEKRVCGTVILYNPEMEVLENVQSYLGQVEELFVIDNSERINSKLVDTIKSFGKVVYVSLNENLGVAKALNIAADLAIDNGFQYLLTMDQDSKTPTGLVNSLLEVAMSSNNVGIVSPLHSNKYGTHLKSNENVEKVAVTMTSGNLLSLEAFQKVGKFCEDFFIDYIDIEYCFRLYCNDYNVFQLNNVVLEHNEANLSVRKLFNKTYYPHNHQPFRIYYKTRNLLYLRKKYKTIVPQLMKIEYDSYIRTIIKIILFENEKLTKLKMLCHGTWDYLNNKKGRRF